MSGDRSGVSVETPLGSGAKRNLRVQVDGEKDFGLAPHDRVFSEQDALSRGAGHDRERLRGDRRLDHAAVLFRTGTTRFPRRCGTIRC